MNKLTTLLVCLSINLFSYGQTNNTGLICQDSLKTDSIGSSEDNDPIFFIPEEDMRFNNGDLIKGL